MAPSATATSHPTAAPIAAGADAPNGNSAAAAIRATTNGLNGDASKQHGLHFDTLAIHKGSEPDPSTGAIIPNIALATAYQQKTVGMSGDKGFDYSRFSNPNRNAFEANVAALEGAKYGFAFASGTAVTSAFMGMVPYGGHVVSVNDVYGGTFKLQGMFKETSNVETTLLDLDTEGMEARLEAAMQPNTKLVWIETPTNPTLRLINIAVVSQIAKRLNPDVYVVVDSTFPSPWYQNPLSLGADAVMHSCTKYINGHSDVLMGVAVTSHEEIARRLKLVQSGLGAVPSPFDCWLVLRGLKTLPIRMREHGRISLRLARYLDAHPLISEVIYPGLPAHPSFKLVKAQIAPKALQAQIDDGVDIEQGIQYSGMLSFRLACDPRDREPGSKLLTELKVITLAVSLGGVESLIEQPSTMTHFMIPEEERLKLGLGHDLIRMSVGLEDPRDLEHDLDQALQKAFSTTSAEHEAKRRKLA